MGLKDLFVKNKRKGEESVGLTQSDLNEWVQALPLLDLPRSIVMLDAALFRLTMSEYRDQSWYELLALLFEPIGTVSRLAYEKFKGDISTSKESKRAVLFFIRKLHLQFGHHCYHMLCERPEALEEQQKMQVAFYALQSYSLVILRSYQLSMMPPKDVWLHLYHTYKELKAYSSEQLTSLLSVENTVYDCKTVLSLFCSPVVLSILSPYKLNADPLEDIYMILNETIDPSIFYEDDMAETDYCFSMNDDRAPSMYQFYPKETPELVFINQKLVLSELTLVVNQGFKVNKTLLECLISTQTRQAERFDCVGKTQIISGIANSYRFLYGQFDGLQEKDRAQKELFTYSDKDNKHWPIIINVYKKFIYPATRSDCEDKLMGWEIIDKSPKGVGLVSQESYPVEELSVNNFAQLNIDGRGRWLSGLIRWMHVKEGGLVSLGIEYLARENIPVYLQSKNQKRLGYKSIAILGKYTFKPWPNVVLITQGVSYREGEEVSLLSDLHNVDIKLTACLITTKNCKIFSFKTENPALIE